MIPCPLPALTPPHSSDSSPSRLRCQKPGVFRCSATGLQLEGAGELLYGPRPWNLDFLKRRGLQPAGPLFSFTILSGSFQRLHLPHCCLLTGQFPWRGGRGVFRREGSGLPPLTTTPVPSRWGWLLPVGSPRDRCRAGAPPTRAGDVQSCDRGAAGLLLLRPGAGGGQQGGAARPGAALPPAQHEGAVCAAAAQQHQPGPGRTRPRPLTPRPRPLTHTQTQRVSCPLHSVLSIKQFLQSARSSIILAPPTAAEESRVHDDLSGDG